MRLTKKELMSVVNQPMCFGSRLVGKKMFAQIIKELCEYKTIEDELGIDLITIWRAKTRNFYFKNSLGEIYPVMFQSIDHITKRIHFTVLNETNIKNSSSALKDYGKTWALTKEELLLTTIRFILYMNDGTIKILYTHLEVELLQGQYKSIEKETLTDEGWKEVLL